MGILDVASASEISQAQSLIARGKEGATRGDPRLASIVNALKNITQEQVREAVRKAEARGLDVSEVDAEGRGFGTRIVGIKEPSEQPTQRPTQQQTEGQAFLPSNFSILGFPAFCHPSPCPFSLKLSHSFPINSKP